MNQSYIAIALRAGCVLLLITAAGGLAYYSFPLTYPFVIALILAVIINPFVEWLEERTDFPRGLNVGIVLSGFLVAGAGFLTLVVAEIVSGTAYLAKILPAQFNKAALFIEYFFTNRIMPLYNRLADFFDGLEAGQQESIITQVQNLGSEIASSTALFLSKILEMVPLFFAFLPNTAAVLIFSLLATFFISKDLHKLKERARAIFPDRLISGAAAVYAELKKALAGFLKAQLALVAITMVLVLIGLLALKVNHALAIAFLIGVVDLLPYLGAGSVFVPWIVYLVLAKQLPLAIGLGILYIIVLLFRQVAEPKILSQSIGLHPLGTLIALFAGFKLFGFLGLIIGPVLLVVIQALFTTGILKEIWLFIKGDQK
ncbi:sporulation integral membrane protein YtvI [Bacillus swezeyi]|uniref:Sporulation integral membrane protein YtvI n=1 Tax=Bacillus swezeyi TaxID=1925020 RepID=A0A5M8RMM5_9BACI|nr:sporulation integral membrane protein YtvI [Bacillus swezeyi]KAA6448630.1 sporulation integral membrane protein YtvI [Bacillus swezeyi]KAA6481738.1 sporulation integral membrane protein YtvI [Bacillus swezeyi]TYS34941.1 sporulation integral membrane protein YtvI [Bacillus swezeyi]